MLFCHQKDRELLLKNAETPTLEMPMRLTEKEQIQHSRAEGEQISLHLLNKVREDLLHHPTVQEEPMMKEESMTLTILLREADMLTAV